MVFTCHNWLPLIELSDGYSTVNNSVYNFFKVVNDYLDGITDGLAVK